MRINAIFCVGLHPLDVITTRENHNVDRYGLAKYKKGEAAGQKLNKCAYTLR